MLSPEGPFEKGIAAVEARKWEEGRELLLRAWAQDPSSKVAANLALCQFHLGDHLAAARYASHGLVRAERHERSEFTTRLEGILNESRKNIGTLELRVAPRDAVVTIDGQKFDARAPFVTPGVHRIVVERRGYRSLEREVELERGETLNLELNLEETRGARPVSDIGEPSPPNSKGRNPLPLLIGGGVTLVGLSVGTGTLLASGAAHEDAQEIREQLLADGADDHTCDGNTASSDCERLQKMDKKSRTLGAASLGTFIGSGIVLAGSLAWYFLQPSPLPHMKPLVEVGPERSILGVQGHF